MNEELEKPFLDIIEKVGDFKQNAKLTYPDLKGYHDSMKLVVGVIAKGEKGICVYGDYDSDGMLSAIMLHRFIENAYKLVRGDEHIGMAKIRFSNRQNSFGLTKEEFISYRKESDIVITVDNGSDISFLSESLRGQLIVLDHHFSRNKYSFVLNPNTGRTEGVDDYSTSGGRIVYDFIKNVDIAMKKFVPEYQNVENHTQLETLRELASITLISDMALMDKENRAFVLESLDTIRANRSKLPVYSKLDTCNTKEFSFNIISQINAMSRMEQDLNIVDTWIAPKTLADWKKADILVEANNTAKKSVVSSAFTYFLKKQSERTENRLVEFLVLPDAPIGILGLLANRISNKEGNKPTIVAGVKNNGDISLSARGEGVRNVLAGILEKGQFGGHSMACGGKIVIEEGNTLAKAFENLEKNILKYEGENNKALASIGKLEVVNDAPLTIGEFKRLGELYVDKCGGVGYYKNIYTTIGDFKVVAEHVFASGWAKISLADSNNKVINFMFNGEEISIEKLKQDGMVAIMEFAPEDSYQIHALIHKSELGERTKPITEAEDLGCIVKEKAKASEVVADVKVSVVQTVWYYQHPESDTAWSCLEPITEIGDGMVDEIDLELFESHKASGKWGITEYGTVVETLDAEVFIPTENPKVFLVERYTEALVALHPDKIFVFDDNLVGRGKAGQAIIRDFPNTMGIPTKRLPSMDDDAFFSDTAEEQNVVLRAINSVHKELVGGKTIIFPRDGLGTGLGETATRSPRIFEIIHQLIADNFTKCYGEFVRVLDEKKEGTKKQYNAPIEKIAP